MHLGTLLGTLGQTLYHFNGVAPIITGTSNPIILNKKYKQSGMDAGKREELVKQEAANQFVTMVVHLLMYYGLSLAVTAVLKKKLPAIESRMRKNIGEGKFQNIVKGSKLIREGLIENIEEKTKRVGDKAFNKALKKGATEQVANQAEKDAVAKLMAKEAKKAAKQEKKKDKLKVENMVTAQVFEYVKIIIANLGGLLGMGVVRPLLGATLFRHLNKKKGVTDNNEQAKNPQMKVYFDPAQAAKPLRRIGQYAPTYNNYNQLG